MRLMLRPAIIQTIEYEFSVLPKLAKAGECETGYQVDALLIELCPGYRHLVEAFYAGDEPPMRETHTLQQLRALDSYLVMVMHLYSRRASMSSARVVIIRPVKRFSV